MSNHSNTKTDSSSKKELKVLFVASGNKTGGNVSSFVRSQFESLQAAGLDMLLFPVSGHGTWAYLKGVWKLRQMVRREKPDIIHAHYSTCGFVASLACLGMWKRPKIMVSILGSFPTRSAKWRRVRWAIRHLWDGALTKSERTRNQLGLELPVIPNGVNLDTFHPIDYATARKAVGFEVETKTEINTADAAINIDKQTNENYKDNTFGENSNDNIGNQKSGDSVCCEQHTTSISADSVIVSELPLPNHPLSSDSVPSTESSPSEKTSDLSSDCEKSEKKYIIWCSHPTRVEKNWPLAEAAIAAANQHLSFVNGNLSLENKSQTTNHKPQISLVPVYDKTPNDVMTYMNAADCLLLTSWSEGSPNVIKEAMACNCPIVTTDVGDVNERLKGLEGCYVAKTAHPVTNYATHALYGEENAKALADCLCQALSFAQRTKGYDRILADGLTIAQTAEKIMKWYEFI